MECVDYSVVNLTLEQSFVLLHHGGSFQSNIDDDLRDGVCSYIH